MSLAYGLPSYIITSPDESEEWSSQWIYRSSKWIISFIFHITSPVDSIFISFISSILRDTAASSGLCEFLRYVYFYSKNVNEEPQQNSITTWNSYNWYLRKIIQSLNYEEKSWQVKLWNVVIWLRHILRDYYFVAKRRKKPRGACRNPTIESESLTISDFSSNLRSGGP